jgi:RNA methyltransferase, TrmH family
MLSKNRLKYIKSLQLKKYRKEEQCFVVEGAKSVTELIQSDFQLTLLAATSSFINQHGDSLARKEVEVISVSEQELTAAGTLQTNDSAIAIAKMKPNQPPVLTSKNYALVLDDIRDPGNLGTIIRTADWYGIRAIIASESTADFYNPKTISASMGSFLRVGVFYTSLPEYLRSAPLVYGTFLKGTTIHELSFAEGGFIVIGNESNGISPEVERLVHQKIMIPRFGAAESLNAGVATAVVLDNLRRSKKGIAL